MVTANPRACKSLANELDIMPFPKEDVTPPVTKIYFVCFGVIRLSECPIDAYGRHKGKLVYSFVTNTIEIENIFPVVNIGDT